MTTCAPTLAAFKCPTKWELWQQLIALLPRGRAWQTHDDAHLSIRNPHTAAEYGSAQAGGSAGLGAVAEYVTLTVLQQFWAAYAEVLEYLHHRACALIEEFYCETVVENRTEWGIDYGFPDRCEPWDLLCEKVRAQGGATCAYLVGIALRRGWVIECSDCSGTAGVVAGCAVAGLDRLCTCAPNEIVIRIRTTESPAWTDSPDLFRAGALVAGCTPPCPPAPEQLICLIERVKPAHVRARYEVF